MRYEQFCVADPIFYDLPSRSVLTERLFTSRRVFPAAWNVHPKDASIVMVPPGPDLPEQGWKIHVSATLDNAAATLDAVWEHCVPRKIAFKFLGDRISFLLCNAKYADRSGSGKFITVYPAGLDQLEQTLHELGAALSGSVGPYVLSDVRWGAGPLYVRYGGFVERYCTLDDGERALAITDPEGRLVPDLREPRFVLPAWVQIPEFLVAAVQARLNPDAAVEFPFMIERPLHFSNGGGIYLAIDLRTQGQVILREARPHAGLDGAGHDAVTRLLREREFLEKLAGTATAPELYEHFVCWEHHFLVEEHIEGETLGAAFVGRFPLVRPDVTDDDIAGYTTWALDILAKVRRGLRTMHDVGIGYGDLHPDNIMVTPDGGIRFVDLELASYLADESSPGLGVPGYSPLDGRTGADVDSYAFASLTLSLFLPLTPMLALDPDKLGMLADAVAERFPVPCSLLGEATEVLRDRRPPVAGRVAEDGRAASRLAAELESGTPDWQRLRNSIRDAILASATPERDDRLFPGDIDQFTYGGTGLAHGAAGVLYALARSGAGRFPEHERWLLDAVRRPSEHPVGLFDGLHGVAYALAELDRLDDALTVLEIAMRTPLDNLPTTLFSGLAGVGLNLLHFAALTGDAALGAQAVEAGSRLVDYYQSSGRPQHAGLTLGLSGQALLHIRLFEASQERQFLDLAEDTLRQDLDRCVLMQDGSPAGRRGVAD